MASYKAFVSSTFEDLKAHRDQVIRSLQAAGFNVDPMEHWRANSRAPREFSAERLANCNLCILLVAFRRGHIPTNEARSITQIEYDEARKRKIDILTFLLDESPETVAAWNPAYDEREKDPEVNAWRSLLRQRHGVQTLGRRLRRSMSIRRSRGGWSKQNRSERSDFADVCWDSSRPRHC